MFALPARTPYDLNFRLLGIPVRVSPWFWGISAMLGWNGGDDVTSILIWVACVFVSIMVHEFGHGLSARFLGYRPEIVLHGMGGLCYSEAERQTLGQRLIVLICGPGAGFVLCGLVVASLFAFPDLPLGYRGREIASQLITINLVWGILNLLPIWPLDGGQITGVLLTMANRGQGMRWAHTISLVAAGCLAAFCLTRGQTFLALFFAFFAFSNFQVLQAMYQQARYYGSTDDDWWRR